MLDFEFPSFPLRTIIVTSYPLLINVSTNLEPINPVAPVTSTDFVIFLRHSFAFYCICISSSSAIILKICYVVDNLT